MSGGCTSFVTQDGSSNRCLPWQCGPLYSLSFQDGFGFKVAALGIAVSKASLTFDGVFFIRGFLATNFFLARGDPVLFLSDPEFYQK